MKIVIGVATADAALREYLASNRTKAIPPEVVRSGYLGERRARFTIHLQALDTRTTPDAIGQWLHRLSRDAEGLILLIDSTRRQLALEYEDAYFVASIPSYPGRVLQNQVHSTLAPVVRHFGNFSQRFDHLRNQRALLLPLDVFRADELNDLRRRMTADKMESDFGGDLDRLISALHRRSRPKTRQRFRRVYFVDERPLWYHYGDERHSEVETTVPPHGKRCWHNSQFRFGRRYDDRRHHNVDTERDRGQVFGDFVNCHGESRAVRGESHLNIFPNGHF